VKKEVRELCAQFRNAEIGSKEWKEFRELLTKKWRFTPWNLLALFGATPIIEVNEDNYSLVCES